MVEANPNEVSYLIQDCGEPSRSARVHYDQLRAWKDPPQYLSDHPYFRVLYPLSREPSLHSVSEDEMKTVNTCGEDRFIYISSESSSESDEDDDGNDDDWEHGSRVVYPAMQADNGEQKRCDSLEDSLILMRGVLCKSWRRSVHLRFLR